MDVHQRYSTSSFTDKNVQLLTKPAPRDRWPSRLLFTASRHLPLSTRVQNTHQHRRTASSRPVHSPAISGPRMGERMTTVKCNACGATYSNPQRDGSTYFH